ncbi:uncharacterized protein C8Q71DRAFT_116941 [Rhodofomes roseus]|uniref:Uncharacterized protein n=1 Tax=Rhodofomes roseus TaxID=34475 RepID=A0ABQ8KD00_9APHY|nr:uncharacterized protein C8Q71DRAFT_116941 [Rhodofomes roseus]KAH9835370.1 hypothetical protein C8Q71DRAFT_116941 [Rhodofomes roseus]
MILLPLNLAVAFTFMNNMLFSAHKQDTFATDMLSNSFGSADIQCSKDAWDLHMPISCNDGYTCWTTANSTECTGPSDCEVGIVCAR